MGIAGEPAGAPVAVHVLFTQEQIQQRVRELAECIARDLPGNSLVAVGVMRGAVMFLADLVRALPCNVEVDWIQVASYGSGTTSSGCVQIVEDMSLDVAGKHVLVVEDIVDTGLTVSAVLDWLRRKGPASVSVCALLSKPSRRQVAVDVQYIGFETPDAFVVGYGLDHNEQYRNLPYIGVIR